MFDEVRLAALKRGADAAGRAVYVTIKTDDLKWLLELAEAARPDDEPRSIVDTIDTPATDYEAN
jgi:hypothetical protein